MSHAINGAAMTAARFTCLWSLDLRLRFFAAIGPTFSKNEETIPGQFSRGWLLTFTSPGYLMSAPGLCFLSTPCSFL